MAGALEGIRVLDMGRVLAGPSSAALMGDMGAEVIKLEQPGRGDDSRGFAPMKNGVSCYYKNFNRSKKGITLDLKTGKDVFLELVKTVDVLVENFRPGTMKKLGLGYEELKKINPGLIYGCISGFGSTGPYRNRAGYDTMSQAWSGVMSITGWPEDDPVRCGASFGDVIGGLNLTIGILAALRQREKTGVGQFIDISLTDGCVIAAASMFEVYVLMCDIFDNRDEWLSAHNTAQEVTVDNIGSLIVPMHAGAYKFYVERGVDVPEALIPPEEK